MENMKRAISAFLALVLVLGMLPCVPVFAGAEEVETQPETVAVETTEAVTVPEETEAEEEIVPETTAAEETLPEETVSETVAEETVPEETVSETVAEETVPEETVSETVAEETVPETVAEEESAAEAVTEDLAAGSDAADAVVLYPITNIEVSASRELTYVGDQVKLTAKLTPDNASYPKVEFYVVEEEEEDAGEAVALDEEEEDTVYDAKVLREQGVLIVREPCTLTVAARALDRDYVYNDEDELVDGPHDSATQKEGGTVTVTFVGYDMEINMDKGEIPEENQDGDDALKLMTNKKLEMSVHYLVDHPDDEEGMKPAAHLPHVKPNVTWYLDEGDDKYASVQVDEDNCMYAVVTAKSVTSPKVVTLYAKDKTINKVDSVSITIYPIPYKVGIYGLDDEGNQIEYTNDTLTVPLKASEIAALREQGIDYLELELTAQVWPVEAEEPMVWDCSDNMVRVFHPDKEEEEADEGIEAQAEDDKKEPEKDTTRATLRVDFREGTTTVTVASKNYPKVKSTVKIVRKACLENGDMDFDRKDLDLLNEGLLTGKSYQLKVYDVRDPKNPTLLGEEDVKWSLSEEDQAYATVSASGKLTAKKGLKEGKLVTVKCEDVNNEDACLFLQVNIRPLATEVRLLPGELTVEGLDEDKPYINGMTVHVDTADGCDPFKLGALVLPGDAEDVNASGTAMQKVTWKSSDTKIATIDKVTNDIVWQGKNGTVTITATAADGSEKKASVKLKFGVQVTGLNIIKDSEDFFLRSGQSWTMKVEFTPAKASDKTLKWELVGENDSKYASISSKGKLTAKTVYEEHIVTVQATAQDGSGVAATAEVLIKPKKDGILVLKSAGRGYEDYVTKTTQTLAVGETIDLDAFFLGTNGDADEAAEVKWKSSDSKIAKVLEKEGESTTVQILKAGKVTITATSVDDKKKEATITLKGVKMVDSIVVTPDEDEVLELACGKSLTLKAKAYAEDGKSPTVTKLAWSIAEGGEKYAKVSGGKVTAIAGALAFDDEPVEVTVVVSATDGSPVEESRTITIYPIAQRVEINEYLGDGEDRKVYINTPAKGTNTCLLMVPGEDTLSLEAKVWPANAMQAVTWKSSNSKIASIDKNTGEVIVKKAGTVTFTATAADGSGKKATFKVTFLAKPSEVTFDMDASVTFAENFFAIAGGKNLKIKPVLLDGNGKKITGKKLEWKVVPYSDDEAAVFGGTEDDGTAYVTSISDGTLKTKKVTEPKMVTVIVRTVEKNDEWEIEATANVAIFPATASVIILDSEGKDIGSKYWVDLNDGELELDAVALGKFVTTEGVYEEAYQGFTWKSSDSKIAKVDKYTGLVTFKKTGTVTIYCYAADGTTVKDSVKITIRK